MTIPIPTHITTANYCNSNFLMWLDYSCWTSWGVAANWPIATHALPCLPRPSLTMKMPSSYSKRRAIMGWPAYMGRSPAYRDESSLRPRRWSWGTNLWWLLTCLKLWKLGAVKPSEETCSTMMRFFLSDASCSPIETALPPCGHEQCKGLGCKAGFSQMDTGLSQPACLWYLHGAVFFLQTHLHI